MSTTLYLITRGDAYYPEGGDADFYKITADKTEAETLFASLDWINPDYPDNPGLGYDWAFLIELRADGWTVLNERQRFYEEHPERAGATP